MLLAVLIISYSVLSAAGVMVIIILMKNAPFGWEDENGFHLGKKDQPVFSDSGTKNSRINFLRYYYLPITGGKARIF